MKARSFLFILPFLAACATTTPTSPLASLQGKADYPADDRLGAVNNLSPEGVLLATELVTTGKTYPMGVVLDANTPAYPGRSFSIQVTHEEGGGPINLGGADDLLHSHIGIGSQIDGLGHISLNSKYYNGVPVADAVAPDGLKEFGTHAIPPIVTRGVLLDMAALMGVDQVAPGTPFNTAEIEAALERQNVTLRRGDVVIFHTGWLAKAAEDPATFIATQPGLGVEGAEYLANLGVVAVGADTAALEALPAEVPEEGFPVHGVLLVKHGVYILETMNTAELASDGVSEFMFVLGQPRVRGSVQAMINPVAIR